MKPTNKQQNNKKMPNNHSTLHQKPTPRELAGSSSRSTMARQISLGLNVTQEKEAVSWHLTCALINSIPQQSSTLC